MTTGAPGAALPAPATGSADVATTRAAHWALLLDGMPHAAWVVELASRRVVAANPGAAALFGRPCEDLRGMRADELAASPEDLAWWDAAAAGDADSLNSDTIVATADGRVLHASRSIGLVGRARDAAGNPGAPSHALVLLCDRSAEQRALVERETLVAELQATLEATADAILVTDLAGGVRAFNQRFAETWAMPLELLQSRDDAAVQSWMKRSVRRMGDGVDYDSRLRALNMATLSCGSDRLELASGQMLERVTRPLLSRGRPLGRVWSFRDLTERLAAAERIEALALCDALTGLPNRRRLADRVNDAGVAARRDGNSFALLIIDLDRFRQINDSLGHDTGDRVLQGVAQRIRSCLREDDVLARLGGDQFALLVQPADAKAAEATARRVLNVVAQPCNIDGAAFTLTCSIGISLGPAQGSRVDDLVRHAETAMRAVKAGGRANFRLHQTRAEGDRRSYMTLDHAMRQALASGRFRLHYQPQIDLASGALIGAEALLRWRDPELGDVAPSRFIPVAEDSGFIVAIGDWVLSQAVRQAALWHSRGRPLPIAINVSALQFQQAQFVDRVASVLAVAGVPAALLELELTESILLNDGGEALQRLQALTRLGVSLAIDDFGTGYSSLAYLKRIPVDKLKIDRSFVAGLPADEGDTGIVSAILQMARALGMKVIAEGVETEAQRQFLLAAGCDGFQGFLLAPGLDALSFEQRFIGAEVPVQPLRPQIRLVSG